MNDCWLWLCASLCLLTACEPPTVVPGADATVEGVRDAAVVDAARDSMARDASIDTISTDSASADSTANTDTSATDTSTLRDTSVDSAVPSTDANGNDSDTNTPQTGYHEVARTWGLDGEGGLGNCLDVSEDGRWMIQESRITAMFLIFERDGAQWRESYRVRTRGLPGFVLGSTTCTLNADGRIAAIGNAASNGEAGGTAYVLVRTGSAWDLRAELFSGDAPGGQRGFGSINGISADGSIVIVGNFDRWLRFRSDNSWASWSREVMGPTGVGASLGWSTTTWEIPCRLSPDGNEFYDVFNGHVFRRSGAAWRLITTWPKDIRFSDNGTRGMVCADVPGLQSLTARCMQYQRSGDSLNTIGTVDIVVHAGPIDYHDPLVDYFGNTVVFDDGTFVLGSFHPDEHWWLFESDGQRFREIETGLPRNRLLMQSAQDGHMLVVNAPYTTVTYARD